MVLMVAVLIQRIDLSSMADGLDTPLYGMQAPGLDGKRPLCTSLREAATVPLEHVRSVQPTRPYQLLGWSLRRRACPRDRGAVAGRR
ncbi:hypothetical protein FHU28_003120 [Micromonospora echinospora]|uniref:Uncharacterized protein n=1 Tax=Micromonospora echinospora TaxID=1877 RepID=A0ABR6MD21_MICEC|nr:hypothetical protein [Micromonospora echinospora]MBB5113281.1 hypothetical protein [Micromonospora echinospora]